MTEIVRWPAFLAEALGAAAASAGSQRPLREKCRGAANSLAGTKANLRNA